MRKTFEEMTDQELRNLEYQLGMVADDNLRSILDGDNEMYDESDLEHWNETIRRIGGILEDRANRRLAQAVDGREE